MEFDTPDWLFREARSSYIVYITGIFHLTPCGFEFRGFDEANDWFF